MRSWWLKWTDAVYQIWVSRCFRLINPETITENSQQPRIAVPCGTAHYPITNTSNPYPISAAKQPWNSEPPTTNPSPAKSTTLSKTNQYKRVVRWVCLLPHIKFWGNRLLIRGWIWIWWLMTTRGTLWVRLIHRFFRRLREKVWRSLGIKWRRLCLMSIKSSILISLKRC